MTAVALQTRQEALGAPFAVGDTVRHPDGRLVKIVGGFYLADDGSVFDRWEWQEVDGRYLSSRVERGRGWRPEMPAETH